MQKLIVTIIMFMFISISAASGYGPAPAGNATAVATKELSKTEHPCQKVISAIRTSDGSIVATCSNREDFRIFAVTGEVVVMKCSAILRNRKELNFSEYEATKMYQGCKSTN